MYNSTYEITKAAKFIKTNSKMVVDKGWGGGDGELVVNGYRVSILQDEKLQEMDGGDVVQQCKCT